MKFKGNEMKEYNLGEKTKLPDIPSYDMRGASISADALFNEDREKQEHLFEGAFTQTNRIELRLEALKREGIRVMSNGVDEYKLVLPANITATQAHALVSSLNPGIEVNYSEDLEEQAETLAKKSKKPFWGFIPNGNTVLLKREF
jgi:hypothetical protein